MSALENDARVAAAPSRGLVPHARAEATFIIISPTNLLAGCRFRSAMPIMQLHYSAGFFTIASSTAQPGFDGSASGGTIRATVACGPRPRTSCFPRCPTRYPGGSRGATLRRSGRTKAITSQGNIAEGGLKAVALANREALKKFLAARRVPADQVEDLLQDLFVKLESQAIGPVAEPRGYLYRILDNQLLDRRRAEARRLAREEAWASQSLGEQDESPSADAVVAGREEIRMVAEALSTLPERTRLMFHRARIEGIPRKRIAEEFGISVSAVEKHLQKAYELIVAVRLRLAAEADPPRRL